MCALVSASRLEVYLTPPRVDTDIALRIKPIVFSFY
jgi:hypothetical protein